MSVQRARRSLTHRRRRRRQLEGDATAAQGTQGARDIRYAMAGPVVRLERRAAPDRQPERQPPGEVPVQAAGVAESHAAKPGHANSVRLEGRTDADFSGSTFKTVGGTTRPAKGCEACGADDCQRATGKVAMTFQVTTAVTLPTPDPNLTPCQLARVQAAIRNTLAPHEQRHVRAFNTYAGTLTRSFDLTLCSADFDAAIQAMFDKVEQPRRAAAQAKSDALDPFFFDVDIDCQEPPKQGKRASTNPTDQSPEAELPG